MTEYQVKEGARFPGARIAPDTLPQEASMTVRTTDGHEMSLGWTEGGLLQVLGVQPPLPGVDLTRDQVFVVGNKIERDQPFELTSVPTHHSLSQLALRAEAIYADVEPVANTS